MMKKLTAVTVLLLVLGAAVFAEDAKVMPMMVGRVYAAPTYAFALGAYDKDGTYKKFPSGSVKVFNLGFAVEYGVIDWITAAVQWAPGWTVWSDLEAVSGRKDSNTNGVADLFVGAKIQLVGEKAPVKTPMFRLSIAPGVIIPLPGPDFAKETTKAPSEKATLQSMDNHAFAAGARVYFDWIINKSFFINLYNETLFYPIAQDLAKAGPDLAIMKIRTPFTNATGEVKYKYKLTFELEPVYTMAIADGISFSAGLPVNFKYVPAYDYSISSGTGSALMDAAALTTFKTNFARLDPALTLSVKPNVSVFFTKTPLPLEFKLQYGLPVWGKNVGAAQHQVTLQIKAYFAIPKSK
ncbi:hypothetical protein AGMMS50230_17190 [Spirochaetia bacterium]|nr:hypothetical protein AGMMS50230_17190 [Spirochaetia bacterium]